MSKYELYSQFNRSQKAFVCEQTPLWIRQKSHPASVSQYVHSPVPLPEGLQQTLQQRRRWQLQSRQLLLIDRLSPEPHDRSPEDRAESKSFNEAEISHTHSHTHTCLDVLKVLNHKVKMKPEVLNKKTTSPEHTVFHIYLLYCSHHSHSFGSHILISSNIYVTTVSLYSAWWSLSLVKKTKTLISMGLPENEA